MKRITITLALLLAAAPLAAAQDSDEMKAKQLVAQIKKDLARIDELLLAADEQPSGAEAKQAMAEVKANLEKLLSSARDAQNQVIDNIEELARLTKYQKSNQSQGEGQDQDSQSKPDPSNAEREKDRDPQGLKEQGEQKPCPDGKQPDSPEPDRSKGEQKDEGAKPPDAETEKHERDDTRGRWGNLPPKVQEQIDARSYDRIPAKYRRILDEYYRKSGKDG
jgi:hypothetical protein